MRLRACLVLLFWLLGSDFEYFCQDDVGWPSVLGLVGRLGREFSRRLIPPA